MQDKPLIKAAATLALHTAMENLKDVAKEYDMINDNEYIENMLMISMVGYSIATGRDKKHILSIFNSLLDSQRLDDENSLVKQAKNLL
tara:strand:+ start:3975 stop:4238 length:264 start_codon:yes stop_codon:yes gene_type:complete